MQAEKIEIPDELRILNPELQKKPVVIGTEAYMIYPLTEGQAERVSKLLSDVIIDITTLDMQCPNCKHVFQNMLGRQETCNRCRVKGKGGSQLKSMQKPPVEALTYEDRVPRLIEELVGIKVTDVKSSLTVNQCKHIAGVLYVQNFMEEEGGGLPEESKKNFKALLNWISPEEKENTVVASEKSMKPLPMNMDLQENISREDGRQEEVTEDGL